MKKMIFYLASFLIFTSCTSIEKLIETGHYEEAFEFAVKKLAGKKNKKTEHVQGLEDAFKLLNESDLAYASRLINQNSSTNWDELYTIYSEIEFRQNLVKPLLPLVSKDGYRANFTFVKVARLIDEAAKNAAAYDYERAITLLNRAVEGDKEAAKNAFYIFEGIHGYVPNYKDINTLQNEAEFLGQTRILLDVRKRDFVFLPREFEHRVLNFNASSLNDRWTKYYTHTIPNADFDIRATLVINNLDVSPERELVKVHVNEKEIKDGYELLRDKKGRVRRDSLGNEIKVASFKKIRAKVTEIRRTKSMSLTGVIKYVDLRTGRRFRSETITTCVNFEDVACTFKGDKRALNSKWNTHLNSRILPFPSNFRMAMDAAEQIKIQFKNRIKRSNL